MKTAIAWMAALIGLGLTAATHHGQVPPQPNFVFFLIDDLGWSDLGCYGSDYYETPHIDRLAKEGMRFTDAYAYTVCSPTRASILTGRDPARLHITHAIPIMGYLRMGKTKTPLMDADYRMNMPLEEVTIAESLKEAGYSTAHIGKWHCSWEKEFFPEHQGFDVNIGGNGMGNPGMYFYPYDGSWSMTKDHPVITWKTLPDGKPGEYLTDRLTEEAERYIEEHRGGPFFLNLWHYAVHTPLQAKQEKINTYAAKPTDTARGQTNAAYAAMIESVDESVGRILKKLEDLGLSQNTIVIFTSDNGGAGKGVTSNHPLRAWKGTFYEGGIRVPTIIKWPGVTKPGSVSHEAIVSMDFYPTMLEMAGLPSRPSQHLDGLNLLPVLKQTGALQREALYWHFPNYIGPAVEDPAGPCSVIRQGDWKLIESLEDGTVQLFNLRQDLGETTDLASAMPDKVRELRAKLESWREQTKVQMPRTNPDYKK